MEMIPVFANSLVVRKAEPAVLVATARASHVVAAADLQDPSCTVFVGASLVVFGLIQHLLRRFHFLLPSQSLCSNIVLAGYAGMPMGFAGGAGSLSAGRAREEAFESGVAPSAVWA